MNLAGSQAARADLNSFNSAIFQDFDTLEVGVELPGADVVSMGDRIAEYRFLFTDMALHGHGNYSYQSGECYQPLGPKSIKF